MAAGDGLDSETPESILIRHEENSMIHALIEERLHLFREVLVLRDVEDMSYHEIAGITGVPACTVMPPPGRTPAMAAAAWNGVWMKSLKETLP